MRFDTTDYGSLTDNRKDFLITFAQFSCSQPDLHQIKDERMAEDIASFVLFWILP